MNSTSFIQPKWLHINSKPTNLNNRGSCNVLFCLLSFWCRSEGSQCQCKWQQDFNLHVVIFLDFNALWVESKLSTSLVYCSILPRTAAWPLGDPRPGVAPSLTGTGVNAGMLGKEWAAAPRGFPDDTPAEAITGCNAPMGVAGCPVALRNGWAAPGPLGVPTPLPGEPGWMNGDCWGTGAENGLKAGWWCLSWLISSTGRRGLRFGVDSDSKNWTNCWLKDWKKNT